MAYRFIEKNQEEFGLRWLLRRMKIHPHAYYNYRKNSKAAYQRQKAEVLEEIRSTYHELGGAVLLDIVICKFFSEEKASI